MPTEQEAVIIATVKNIAHGYVVEGSEQEAPTGVVDCSTLMVMDAAGRILLLETIGARPACDDRARRHVENRRSQPSDGLESPSDAEVAHLAKLIGDQSLVVWWILDFDLASL